MYREVPRASAVHLLWPHSLTMEAVQATLERLTGRRTVPNVFVGGRLPTIRKLSVVYRASVVLSVVLFDSP